MNQAVNPVAEQTPPARPRRSNPERSATTRKKIFDGAIHCLRHRGYEGTSISLVAEQAGVSKGATQHHFPSKTDLMLAVAEYCLDLHSQIRADIFKDYEPGSPRLAQTARASWEIINDPSYVALIEIMMATRNNPDLKQRFAPLNDRMAEMRELGATAYCQDFGVPHSPLVDSLIRTHVAAMRGIAIGMMFSDDKEACREELDMMQRYERAMTDFLMAEAKKEQENQEK